MKRIILINPPYLTVPGKYEEKVKYYQMPLGISYLASYLRSYEKDIEIKLLDANALGLKIDEIVDEVEKFNPDIVGITATTLTSSITREILKRVKEKNSKILKCVGGPHPTALPFDMLPDADICVLGEGERTITEILRYLDGDFSIEKINGISYIDGGGKKITSPREYINNLDKIPFPSHSLLPLSRYHYAVPYKSKKRGYATIITSRGCPYNCSFCQVRNIWGKGVRYRSIENVLEEIENVVNHHGINFIYFIDDILTLKRKRIMGICEEIIKRKLKFRWACLVRADRVDLPLLKIMKKSGCVDISVGVESGNQEVLDRIGKRTSIGQLKKVFKMFGKAGLRSRGFFMIGNSGETKETVEDTINLAKELNPTYAFFYTLIPFPGSQVFEEYKRKGYIKTFDWGKYNYYGDPVFETEKLSKRDLFELRKKALNKFYLRPGKILSYLYELLRTGQFQVVLSNFFAFLSMVSKNEKKSSIN